MENLNMIEVGNAIYHMKEDIDKGDKQDQSYLTKQQLKIYTEFKYLYPFPKSVKELENKLNGSSIKEILPLQKNAIKEYSSTTGPIRSMGIGLDEKSIILICGKCYLSHYR